MTVYVTSLNNSNFIPATGITAICVELTFPLYGNSFEILKGYTRYYDAACSLFYDAFYHVSDMYVPLLDHVGVV